MEWSIGEASGALAAFASRHLRRARAAQVAMQALIKVRDYAAVASIRRYVIVESTSIGLTVFQRDNGNEDWRDSTLTEAETLRMPEIGIEVPVDEFYADVAFPPSVARGG